MTKTACDQCGKALGRIDLRAKYNHFCSVACKYRFRYGSDGSGLTARRRRVLDLAGEGKTNKEIAAEMGLSARTVTVHLSNAYHALGLFGAGARYQIIRRKRDAKSDDWINELAASSVAH